MYIDVYIDDSSVVSDGVDQASFAGVYQFTIPADLTDGPHHFVINLYESCGDASFSSDRRSLDQMLDVANNNHVTPPTPPIDAYRGTMPDTGMQGWESALLLALPALAGAAAVAGFRSRRPS